MFLNSFIFNSDILSIILFLFALITTLLFKREYRLFYLFNLVFITSIFKVSFFPTSLVTILIFGFSVVEFLIFAASFFRKNSYSPRNLILPLFILLLLIAHMTLMWFIIKDGRPSFNRIISFANTLIFTYTSCLFIRRNNLILEKDFSKKFLINYIVNFLMFSFLSFPVFFPALGEKFFIFTNFGTYSHYVVKIPGVSFNLVRFSTVFQDPNIASLFAAVTLALSLIYIKTLHEYLGKALSYVFILFTIGVSILSFSKMGILTIFLILGIKLILYLYETKKAKRKINPLILYGPIFVFAFLFIFMNNFVMKFISRFSEGYMLNFETTLNSLSTNRFFTIKEIVADFLLRFDIILFGTGIESQFFVSSFGNIAHDTFIQTITSLGIVFTIVFAFFINSIRKSLKINNSETSEKLSKEWVIMIAPALNFFFLGILTYSVLYVTILLVFALLSQKSTRKEQINA